MTDLIKELYKGKDISNAYVVNIAASQYFTTLGEGLLRNKYLFIDSMNVLSKKLGIIFDESLMEYDEFRAGIIRVYSSLNEEVERYLRSKTKDRLKIEEAKVRLIQYFIAKDIEKIDVDKNRKTLENLLTGFYKEEQEEKKVKEEKKNFSGGQGQEIKK